MTSLSKENIQTYYDYYRAYFPYISLYKWIMYDGYFAVENREWSYQGYSTINSQEFVKRHKQMRSAQELYDLVSRETNSLILKLDIGPYYNQNMNTKETSTFAPKQRELVFDIDADDYKEIRKCCQGANMCEKCWRFMECAAAMISYFVMMFGFQDFMFCFSGRRGLHGWIVDEKARVLQLNARETIIQAFNIVELDRENQIAIKYNPKALNHYHLFQIAEVFFNQIKDEQGWFTQHIEETRNKIHIINNGVEKEYKLTNTELEKMEKQQGDQLINSIKNSKPIMYQRIVLYFTAPRLDINVSKQMNHLLKLPFSIHSKSMFVSVPVCAHAIVEYYGLQDLIKFPKTYKPIGYRYQIQEPIRPYDHDRLTHVIRWFEQWVDNVIIDSKQNSVKDEQGYRSNINT